MKTILQVMVLIVMILGFFLGLGIGMRLNDQRQCHQLQEDAITYYPSFYLTQSELDQCEYLHIPVRAPVK